MKILILKQNINQIILDKGLLKVQQKLQGILQLDFTQQFTSKKFSSVPAVFAQGSGYQVNPAEILAEEKLYGNFDIVALIYDPSKLTPAPTNPTDNADVIQIPSNWYEPSTAIPPEDIFCDFFLHELCHELFWQTKQLDSTHNYVQGFPDRISWYIYLIKALVPFLKPQNAPQSVVTLKRGYTDSNEQLGDLTVGSFACKTLELPWKLNIPNISCIPKGTYTVKWTFSLKLLRYTYEVTNVPNRSGVRFHPGNFFFNVQGCILLGDKYGDLNRDSSADLLNSTITIKAFEDYLGRKPFLLQII